MQIFAFDEDVGTAAAWLCDKHVVKQPLEAVQILNAALHLAGAGDLAFYRSTHPDHPWVVWAAGSLGNWAWALRYAMAVGDEYSERYGREHESVRKLRDSGLSTWTVSGHVPAGDMAEPPLVTGGIDAGSVWESYREYYRSEKSHLDWFEYARGTEPPAWLND